MNVVLIILVALLFLALIVVTALLMAEIAKLQGRLKTIEKRLHETDEHLARQEEAIHHLIEAVKRPPQTADPLMGAVAGLLELPSRGLWPTMGLLASRLIAAYWKRKGQPALPANSKPRGNDDA